MVRLFPRVIVSHLNLMESVINHAYPRLSYRGLTTCISICSKSGGRQRWESCDYIGITVSYYRVTTQRDYIHIIYINITLAIAAPRGGGLLLPDFGI
jgi:hypothetical protein